MLFKDAFPCSARSSLSHILDTLGIQYAHLHNAGNDARYCLMAFLRLQGISFEKETSVTGELCKNCVISNDLSN